MAEVFAHGHALLIGVGGNLPGTVKDATALYKLLTDPTRAAYPPKQVDLLTAETAIKPTRQNILHAFEQLITRANADSDSTAVVYYSGHGGRVEVGEQSLYYLVPHGYNPLNKPDTAITGQEFTDRITALKARKLLVFLDCCYAGGIPMVKAGGAESETFTSWHIPPELAALALGGGQVIVTSSRAGEASWADEPYSVFTAALLRALRGKGAAVADGYARILNVLAYLLAEVPQGTDGEQHPLVKKILDLDDNFPVCFYAAGSKSASEAPDLPPAAAPPPAKLNPAERQQLTVERTGLEQALDSVTNELNILRQLHATETTATIQCQYEQRMLGDEAEVKRLKARIAELTSALAMPAGEPEPDPHLIQRRAELKAQYDLLSEAIAKQRKKLTVEYNPVIKIQFQQQLQDLEGERSLIWTQIQAINAALAAEG